MGLSARPRALCPVLGRSENLLKYAGLCPALYPLGHEEHERSRLDQEPQRTRRELGQELLHLTPQPGPDPQRPDQSSARPRPAVSPVTTRSTDCQTSARPGQELGQDLQMTSHDPRNIGSEHNGVLAISKAGKPQAK